MFFYNTRSCEINIRQNVNKVVYLELENRSKVVRFRKNAGTFCSLIRTPTRKHNKSSNVSNKDWVDHLKKLYEVPNTDYEENVLSNKALNG